MRWTRLPFTALSAACALAIACGSCKSKPEAEKPTGHGILAGDRALVIADAPPGLAVRLSEGQVTAARRAGARVAKATRLPDARALALVSRMSDLKADADDRKAFALRERSQPPPRTGETIDRPFPPPVSTAPPVAPDVDPKQLRVVRHAPEGEVPIAPHLSITFDQPMVAVTSHGDSVAGGVPVTLTPQPPGQWRWIGTRTLLFDPEVRFPMATEFEVTIPAGTVAATGAPLKEAVSFRFATPPPNVVQSHPTSGPQPLEPLIFVAFDQKIDPAAVLATVSLEAGGRSIPVRAATAAEIAADRTVSDLVAAQEKAEHEGRFLVLRPTRPLPPDASVTVDVGPGTPSLEGPRKTRKAHSFSFRTYGPLKVVESRCAWGRECPPATPWMVRFSNPLDADAFDGDAVTISPELPRRRFRVSGEWLTIEGMSKGRTTYTVELPATVQDRFGQTLGASDPLTFQVGDAQPRIFASTGLVVLDPAAKRATYAVHSVNVPKLDVRVYRVEPADWSTYLAFLRKNPRQQPPPPGTKVVDTTVSTRGPAGEMVETAIDLSAALGASGKGHAVVSVEPTSWPHRHKPQIDAWVQATDIGLDAYVDAEELLAWATDLETGKSLPGVSLTLAPHRVSARTGADGLATLALPAKRSESRAMVVARKGDDVAFLPENTYHWSNQGGWHRRDGAEQLSWFVFDDRQMYRPKETVHVKGWLRRVDLGEGGDVGGLRGAVSSLRYRVVGPRGNELTKGTTKVNALGGFDLRFDLPDTPNLGHARLELDAVGQRLPSNTKYAHSFQIQEFRRPEFEVGTETSEGPHLVGGGADVTASAKYYAGGPLQNAEVAWSVTSSPTSFTPPNRDDFTFGIWTPWWGWHGRGQAGDAHGHESFAGTTDAAGRHVLHIDFLSASPPRPMSLVAEARVTDVNRQAWAASSTLLVHPSELYVGLKRDRYFFEQGKPIELDTIVVDHDGAAIADRDVTVRSVRLDWAYDNGEYVETETDEEICAVRSGMDAVPCSFQTPEGGTYRITATTADDAGRPNQTQLLVWVTGGKQPPSRNVEREEVTLVPDAKEYQPGDTASVLVQAPFSPAEGVLTVRRSGLVRSERFTMDGPTTTLAIPIHERHVPNVHVQVDLVGAATRVGDDGTEQPDLPKRPAYAGGSLNLPVPPKSRTLAVAVEPAQRAIEPGGATKLSLRVRDAKGAAVSGAELAVIVVDESVLALSNYQTPNPLAAFYTQRPAGVSDFFLRQYVMLARPELAELAQGGVGGEREEGRFAADSAVMEAAPAPTAAGAPRTRAAKMAVAANGQAAQPAITVRKNFEALAVFAPEVRTDARGRATVPIELPDNLTRYRIMAVAVHGEKEFGHGEANITARMPLMVRPSPPRFLNFGDRFELPVVLQNQTEAPMQVEVGVRATNLAFTEGQGRRLTVPANDRVEVRFPAAAEMPGIARFQVAAASGAWTDGAEHALPVWTPATTEAFATYGVLEEGAVRQPVKMPEGVVEEFGGLEVTTSSTQLQALTDAVLYLVQYPFEGAEQTASRVLAVAALRDVLDAFAAERLPPPKEIEAAVRRDIERLKSLQNWDGGFAFWTRGHESWPYVSIHAAHALARAGKKGFEVPADMIQRSLAYLKEIERHIPHYYPEAVRRTLIAYALYTRKQLGDLDVARAKKLLGDAGTDGLSMEALGWILSTLTGDRGSASERQRIVRHLDNKVTETAATAHWSTSYADGAHLILHSSRRADGILLEALIGEQPKSDLIPKVVRGLLAHRTRGHWQNTQENAFVLLSMDAYFQAFEKVTPRFVARLWLGDGFVGEQRYRGRSTNYEHVDIPMAYLATLKGTADLTLQKQGRGRLYYRVGMTYAPEDLKLPPADHGFAVERIYEPVDDPGDVVRQADGTWRIKAGAPVRVRVTMVAEARRTHVALVDPLPAGLEAMNPALAVTGTVPADPKAPQQPFWWWLRPWYEHQNLRDERAEAFTSLLPGGVHEYSYVARATTPGRFVVPPAKAEEMYFPETFGRSAGDVVVVE